MFSVVRMNCIKNKIVWYKLKLNIFYNYSFVFIACLYFHFSKFKKKTITLIMYNTITAVCKTQPNQHKSTYNMLRKILPRYPGMIPQLSYAYLCDIKIKTDDNWYMTRDRRIRIYYIDVSMLPSPTYYLNFLP